jgi:hypothetical protein
VMTSNGVVHSLVFLTIFSIAKIVAIFSICITFLSPLRGSLSSTMAPRVIPHNYFLL